jgi:hypothetical protein
MAVTGQRGAQRPAPGNVTGTTFYRQQREQEARKRAEDNPVDAEAIRREAFEAGHATGWEQAIEWIITRMIDVGLDPDILVVGDVEHQDDDDDEPVED